MPEYDPFETETGLRTDYDFEIYVAQFVFGEKFENWQLELRGAAYEDGEMVSDNQIERYNLGKGWISEDEGRTVTKPGAKRDAKFNVNSNMGQLITRMVEVAPEYVKELREEGLSPMHAKIWEDTSWHMGEFTRGEGEYKSTKNYPVRFNGRIGAPKLDLGPPPELEVEIRALAKSAGGYKEFLTKALALEGVQEYSGLVSQIGDSEWYEKLKES